jgi:adenylate kinase
MILAISGIPGTGKTTLAKYISAKFSFKQISGTKLLKKMPKAWDPKRKCSIISESIFRKTVFAEIKKQKQRGVKHFVIDSHLAHVLPPKKITALWITTCPLKTLQKRLKKRNYSDQKIRENIDAQIFDTCYIEAKELGHNPIKIETPFEKKEIIRLIQLLLSP